MFVTVIDDSLFLLLNRFDGGQGHHGRLVAEAHQANHPQRRAYGCKVIHADIQLDKQVTGEKGFDDFLPALAPAFSLHGVGTVSGEALALQVVGGEVFLVWLGLHDVPVFMIQDFPLLVPLALAQLLDAVRPAPAPAFRILPACALKTAG